MQFSIGDKILLKKENMQAEIIRINSLYKVTILSRDGFEMNVSVKDLIRIEKGTDKATSYGVNFYSKDSDINARKSQKKERSQSVLKVDLHIELLNKNHMYMDNFEIVQTQLNECHKRIEKALNSKINKLEIIHGIGEGILRKEVHTILRNYNLRFYLTKDGGATEVYF